MSKIQIEISKRERMQNWWNNGENRLLKCVVLREIDEKREKDLKFIPEMCRFTC